MRPKQTWSVATGLLSLTLVGAVLAVPADAATKLVPWNFGVECPEATRPGETAPCHVYIDNTFFPDAPQPTGTVKLSVPSYKGSVTPTSCDAAEGSCSIAYTPKGAGSGVRKDTITASYSGDSVWQARRTSATIAVPVKLPVTYRMHCNPTSTRPGLAVRCSATVYIGTASQSDPTGSVRFTVSSSRGTLNPTSCVIDSDQTCGVSYTPKGTATPLRKDRITATYSGDADWTSTTKTTEVAVPPRLPVGLNHYCVRNRTTPGVPETCTVEVHPSTSGPTPTGSVTLTVPSYKGTVSPATCPASPDGCTYTYTPKGTGSATRTDIITASYPGDSYWAPNRNRQFIEVAAP